MVGVGKATLMPLKTSTTAFEEAGIGMLANDRGFNPSEIDNVCFVITELLVAGMLEVVGLDSDTEDGDVDRLD